MFEGVVSYILNKYLSRYIDNLDTDSLNISVWSGQVELTDLTLKPEALVSDGGPADDRVIHFLHERVGGWGGEVLFRREGLSRVSLGIVFPVGAGGGA